MKTIEESFNGQAGVNIQWKAWLPDTDPVGVIVVAHGFGEHIDRYMNLVNAAVPRGYAVYGPDHRGHGRSGGERALIDKHDYLLDDLDRVFARVARDHPGLPVFLLGHSMGGNIALASALRNQERLRGLVLSGPAVTTAGVSKILQIVAAVLGRVVPKLGVQQLSSAGVSRDPAVVAAYDADPLVFHGKMPAGTGAALLKTSKGFPARLPELKVPLLVVHGSADSIVSVESGRTAHALAGSTDKTLKIYDGLFHEVFNEPEHATVLADVLDWIDAHRQMPSAG
jgi:alpha-beta hydrolase superfamily lysophospholipase